MGGLAIHELVSLVGGRLDDDVSDCSGVVHDVGAFDAAQRGHVAFLEKDSLAPQLAVCQAEVVLVNAAVRRMAPDSHPPLIVVDDPLGAFITVMLSLRPPLPRPCAGVSEQCVISPSARIGREAIIQAGAFIGADVVIGDRCHIHPGVVIQAGCLIGDDVTIHPNAVLYPNVVIGDRVIIHATSVLGADGFGYRFLEGRFQRIPHTGTVRIEDDVEIGAGTTIDRAMIGETVIGEGSKIDNQVMIGHNCIVGRHNAFASQAGLAGSVTTGDYVRLGGQVGVADHARLGAGCSLGAKAGVRGEVPAGQDYHGYPALPVKEAYRVAMSLPKVPEMRKQLRELEGQIERLREELSQIQRSDREQNAAA